MFNFIVIIFACGIAESEQVSAIVYKTEEFSSLVERVREIETARSVEKMYHTRIQRKVSRLEERVVKCEAGAKVIWDTTQQALEIQKVSNEVQEIRAAMAAKESKLESDIKALVGAEPIIQPWVLKKLTKDIKILADNNTRLELDVRTLMTDNILRDVNNVQISNDMKALVGVDNKLATKIEHLNRKDTQLETDMKTLNANTNAMVANEVKIMGAKDTELESQMKSLVKKDAQLETGIKDLVVKEVQVQNDVKTLVTINRKLSTVAKILDKKLETRMREMVADSSHQMKIMVAKDTKLENDMQSLMSVFANKTHLADNFKTFFFQTLAANETCTKLATKLETLVIQHERLAGNNSQLAKDLETLVTNSFQFPKFGLDVKVKSLIDNGTQSANNLTILIEKNLQFEKDLKYLAEENKQLSVALNNSKHDTFASNMQFVTDIKNLAAKAHQFENDRTTLVAKDLKLENDIKTLRSKHENDTLSADDVRILVAKNSRKQLITATKVLSNQVAIGIRTLEEKDAQLANETKILSDKNIQFENDLEQLVAKDLSLETAVKTLDARALHSEKDLKTLAAKNSLLEKALGTIEVQMDIDMKTLAVKDKNGVPLSVNDVRLLVAKYTPPFSQQLEAVTKQVASDIKTLEERDTELVTEINKLNTHFSTKIQQFQGTNINNIQYENDKNTVGVKDGNFANRSGNDLRILKLEAATKTLSNNDGRVESYIKKLLAKDTHFKNDITTLMTNSTQFSTKIQLLEMQLDSYVRTLDAKDTRLEDDMEAYVRNLIAKDMRLENNNVETMVNQLITKVETLALKDKQFAVNIEIMGSKDEQLEQDVKKLASAIDSSTGATAADNDMQFEHVKALQASHNQLAADLKNLTIKNGGVDVVKLETEIKGLQVKLATQYKILAFKDQKLEHDAISLTADKVQLSKAINALKENNDQLASKIALLGTKDVQMEKTLRSLTVNNTQIKQDIKSLTETDLQLVEKDKNLAQDVYTAWMCNDSGIKCFSYYTFKSGLVEYKHLAQDFNEAKRNVDPRPKANLIMSRIIPNLKKNQ